MTVEEEIVTTDVVEETVKDDAVVTANKSVDEEFDNPVRSINADGLTKFEIAKRLREVNELSKNYPDVPAHFIELLWNWIQKTPEEEVLRVFAEKNKSRNTMRGGTIKGGSIDTKESEEPGQLLSDEHAQKGEFENKTLVK